MTRHIYDLRYYKPGKMITFILGFLPYKTTVARHKTLLYKQLFNRKYIYQVITIPVNWEAYNG